MNVMRLTGLSERRFEEHMFMLDRGLGLISGGTDTSGLKSGHD